MSSLKERMTDLFIPVGRPESSTSTVRTDGSVNTATASGTVQSASTPPTTICSKTSVRDATPQSPNIASPSSIRYTISGPAPDAQSRQGKSEAGQTPRNERPNAVHVRRHSRRLTCPVSPIQELTRRLSRATGSDAPDSIPPPHPSQTPPLLSGDPTKREEAASKDETPLSAMAPTPFTSPEILPVQVDFANLPDPRASPVSLAAKTSEPPIKFQKPEIFPAHLQPPVVQRTQSQSSSRSDRALPPASFPSDFYVKSTVNQHFSRRLLSRSNSTKDSARSTSPLKNNIDIHETGDTKPGILTQHNHKHESRHSDLIQRQAAPASNHSSISIDDGSVTFHTIVHHYQSCPHTCPPSTRPLNIQPILCEEFDPPLSVLSGSCFECDTLKRRDLESSILLGYNPRISAHITELSTIIARLEALSPVSPMSPSALSERLQSLTMGDISPPKRSTAPLHPTDDAQVSRRDSQASLVSEDSNDEPIAIRTQVLEDRIDELTRSRDAEVRTVWKGYTQRWGPGTLGLLKSIDTDRASIGTPRTGVSSRMSVDSERSQYGTAEGRMKVDWIRGRIW